ncbi:hypothetical protein J8273_0296 [Carpediemonas membranifera]|uniref:Uncharacterized protein n=1 Tax=Carpediemonas membranifera TaxID=201153 RepID=A0A8J6EAQ3_9EUKA|nr:hypothetical protein J8273_0296 [Carpediemonas membranifera]|eukprot:KAG9395080.1 hypothetical protein J8273_0296 [Carpediemonas membranifera]
MRPKLEVEGESSRAPVIYANEPRLTIHSLVGQTRAKGETTTRGSGQEVIEPLSSHARGLPFSLDNSETGDDGALMALMPHIPALTAAAPKVPGGPGQMLRKALDHVRSVAGDHNLKITPEDNDNDSAPETADVVAALQQATGAIDRYPAMSGLVGLLQGAKKAVTHASAPALHTLSPGLIWAVLLTHGVDPDLSCTRKARYTFPAKLPVFLCKEFFAVFTQPANGTDSGGNRHAHDYLWRDGRLFTKGGNKYGQRGQGRGVKETRAPGSKVQQFCRVRVPFVCRVHVFSYSVLASTPKGLYAWGHNANGQLGLATADKIVWDPTLVRFTTASAVAKLEAAQPEWHRDRAVTLMATLRDQTCYVQTPAGVVAAGNNRGGSLAVGSSTALVRSFRPVIGLPELSRLTCFTSSLQATAAVWCHCGRTLLVAGENRFGRFGVPGAEVRALTDVGIPVLRWAFKQERALLLSDGVVMVTGKTGCLRAFLPGQPDECHEPTPLAFPWPVTRFISYHGETGQKYPEVTINTDSQPFWVQRADTGQLYGLGNNDAGHLGVGARPVMLTEWRKVRRARDVVAVVHGAGVRSWFKLPDGAWLGSGNNEDGQLGVERQSSLHPLDVVDGAVAQALDGMEPLAVWELDPGKTPLL